MSSRSNTQQYPTQGDRMKVELGATESRAREERTGPRPSAREDAVAVIGQWELPYVASKELVSKEKILWRVNTDHVMGISYGLKEQASSDLFNWSTHIS
jgi:hypothetical protein